MDLSIAKHLKADGKALKRAEFNQRHIDMRRTNVLLEQVRKFYKLARDAHLQKKEIDRNSLEYHEVTRPYHLWWPKPDLSAYSMRPGEAPPRKSRPEHLRDKDIEIRVLPIIRKIELNVNTILTAKSLNQEEIIKETMMMLQAALGKDGDA